MNFFLTVVVPGVRGVMRMWQFWLPPVIGLYVSTLFMNFVFGVTSVPDTPGFRFVVWLGWTGQLYYFQNEIIKYFRES